jgi:hypothetical protein
LKTKIFSSTLENAFYNAGVVAVNLKVIGLSPGLPIVMGLNNILTVKRILIFYF